MSRRITVFGIAIAIDPEKTVVNFDRAKVKMMKMSQYLLPPVEASNEDDQMEPGATHLSQV